MARDIFVSYASADKSTADALVHHLESHGVSCWVAPRDIAPGRDYAEEIITAIRESAILVLVFSAQANLSQHVLREVDRAIGFQKLIVPIKIDGAKPTGGMDYRLCTVQWIEAGTTPIPDKAIRDTIAVLAALRRTESVGATSESFLESLLGRNRGISIVTGAMHSTSLGAEVVLDWDMRTAANLLSHFAAHGFSVVLEPPLLPPESMLTSTPDSRLRDYVALLRRSVCGKHAIVVGSADHNPLTEVLLGDLHGVSEDRLFRAQAASDFQSEAFIAYQKRAHSAEDDSTRRRFFFHQVDIDTNRPSARGFASTRLPHGQLEKSFVSQIDAPAGFGCLAHLLIAQNPYSVEPGTECVLVLNGVNGPATFSLFALLAGRLGKPDQSRALLRELFNAVQLWRGSPQNIVGIELLIEATVELTGWQTPTLVADNRSVSSCRIIPGTVHTLPRLK